VDEELRVVRLVVPGRSPRSILVDGDGNLPAIRLTIGPGDTTVGAVARTVLPSLGFDGHVVDFYIDQSRVYSAGDVVPAYVELAEPEPSWTSPDGWHDDDVSGPAPQIEAELAPRLTQWIDERLGRAVPDPLRAPWTLPGWYERACAWIDRALADAQRSPATAIVQHRHWGISSVMRVETEGGRVWFKAVSEHFRREPSATAFIAGLAPDAAPGVVAWDAGEGWMLLDDLHGDAAPDEHGHRMAYERLAELQAMTGGRHHELLAAGCVRRPLIEIPGDLANVLDDPMFAEWLPVDSGRAARIVDWLVAAVERVEQLGLPDVLVHGDFHPGNVRLVDERPEPGRMVIFDWSDAAIAKPFVDVMTWATWLTHDASARDALWQSFADVWADVLPPAVWLELRPTLEGIAGAYHVVSYAGIVRSLDRLRRPEHAGGMTEFFRFLDEAVSDAGL
jgi:aminoglycoside/choline kinase family phosphotransferase